MASARLCDRCGGPGARRVTASLSVVGLARPEMPTGATLTADACPPHYVDVVRALQAHLVEHLAEQGDFHAQLAAADASRGNATTALATFEQTVLRAEFIRCEAAADAAHAAAKAVLPADAPAPERPDPRALLAPEIRTQWNDLRAALDAAGAQHTAVARAATVASDAKHARVLKDLAKA